MLPTCTFDSERHIPNHNITKTKLQLGFSNGFWFSIGMRPASYPSYPVVRVLTTPPPLLLIAAFLGFDIANPYVSLIESVKILIWPQD